MYEMSICPVFTRKNLQPGYDIEPWYKKQIQDRITTTKLKLVQSHNILKGEHIDDGVYVDYCSLLCQNFADVRKILSKSLLISAVFSLKCSKLNDLFLEGWFGFYSVIY